MTTEIRTYNQDDQKEILAIFHSNCPKYFDSNDLHDFTNFLKNVADDNFKVIIADDHIIGCGGYYVNHQKKVFGIAWVMFKRYVLGSSSFLKVTTGFFNYILAQIIKEKFNYDIVVNTTQLLEKTFYKFGFSTENIFPNGFGKNLDHYVMRRKLDFKE